MKAILTLLCLIPLWSPTNAQETNKATTAIRAKVQAIDHSGAKPQSFKLSGNTYEYISIRNQPVKMVYHTSAPHSTTEQLFYMQANELIYATEKISSFYGNNRADSMIWAGSYYFSKGKLIDLSTLGHGKSETDSWDPEKEVLKNYRQVRKVILDHQHKHMH